MVVVGVLGVLVVVPEKGQRKLLEDLQLGILKVRILGEVNLFEELVFLYVLDRHLDHELLGKGAEWSDHLVKLVERLDRADEGLLDLGYVEKFAAQLANLRNLARRVAEEPLVVASVDKKSAELKLDV